ncbi:MAG: anthrax toxin-like adenylyl cyclase domain-containing protein [bacterium]
MALLFNNNHFLVDVIGMPETHADMFCNVAASQKCMILCRAVGPSCRQLLEEGYDTKGFRIHGKSCDWGPMAGFVLRDPRLNKEGASGVDNNRREHAEALTDARRGAGWTASTTPLKILQERVEWLLINNYIQVNERGGRLEGRAVHHTGISFDYSLIREPEQEGLWGVYFDKVKNGEAFRQERGNAVVRYHPRYGGNLYEPMLAMTNPVNHRQYQNENFRNAITGDYDLFAIWPYREHYQHEGYDRRILGTANAWSERNHIANDLERNFTVEGQGTKMGNITNRIYCVSQFLNSMIGGVRIRDWGPFPNRMVCWHSDEAARPFVNDVDLPIIAFAPSRAQIGVSTIGDFRDLISLCQQEDFYVTLHEGWVLNPQPGKANRLGQDYAPLVPQWMRNPQPWNVPAWYNR